MKKTIFFSMLLAIGVSAYANPSVVINDNNNSNTIVNDDDNKPSEQMYICNADCLLGSCSVSCPAPESGGGGGAICTCYGAFPSCACGEGHSGGGGKGDAADVTDVSVSNQQHTALTNLSSISQYFDSRFGIEFHRLIRGCISRGPFKKSTDKRDIERYSNLVKLVSKLSRDEKQQLDAYVRKHGSRN